MDFDLAELYQVPTSRLNEAEKRNIERFPEDFMFRFSDEELNNWRSQFAISNPTVKMGLRRPPYAFTEQGVAMLSSVLNSKRAIAVNIAIMRAFVKLRQIMSGNKQIAKIIEKLETEQKRQQLDIAVIFQVIKKLITEQKSTGVKIGFRT